jgi:hypothetical protein
VSYVLGKISVKFDGFIRYFKEVRKNVSIISEQPSYNLSSRQVNLNITYLDMYWLYEAGVLLYPTKEFVLPSKLVLH